MRTKKIIKILLINFFILLILFLVLECLFYFYFQTRRVLTNGGRLPYFYNQNNIYKMRYSFDSPPSLFKEYDKNLKLKKPPILLLGCSYAYGVDLDEEDTPEEQLKKLSQRWVYNMSMTAKDPMYNLITLERENKFPHIKSDKPKYIIYIYMFHQIYRLLSWYYFNSYRQHNYIENQKYNFLYKSYIYSYFKNRALEKELLNEKDNSAVSNLFFNIMKDMKKQTDKLYPDSKFIFLIYSDENRYSTKSKIHNIIQNPKKMQRYFDIMNSLEFKNGLENLGFEVISTEELIGRKMGKPKDITPTDPTDLHPSASAWREILPKFVNKTGL